MFQPKQLPCRQEGALSWSYGRESRYDAFSWIGLRVRYADYPKKVRKRKWRPTNASNSPGTCYSTVVNIAFEKVSYYFRLAFEKAHFAVFDNNVLSSLARLLSWRSILIFSRSWKVIIIVHWYVLSGGSAAEVPVPVSVSTLSLPLLLTDWFILDFLFAHRTSSALSQVRWGTLTSRELKTKVAINWFKLAIQSKVWFNM